MEGNMKRAPSPDVPDTVLPVQYFTRTVVSDTPEKRLIFAVLMDAIVQLQRSDERSVAAASSWIRDEIEGVAVSFSEACEILGLEPRSFARGLLSWSAQSEFGRGIRARPVALQQRVTPTGRLRVRARRDGVATEPEGPLRHGARALRECEPSGA
jgi:hypothetical protein